VRVRSMLTLLVYLILCTVGPVFSEVRGGGNLVSKKSVFFLTRNV
jgi:biotin transporter BioY